MNTSTTVPTLALAFLATLANAHEGDYGLWTANGRVQTALANDVTGLLEDFGLRVFAAELVASGGGQTQDWSSDEPGIFIAPASLPDNTPVGFTILSNLRFWDGTGPVSITDAANPMQLQFGPESRSTPTDGSSVAGFTINYDADAPGGFDEHFDFLLPASPAGVYFLEMSFNLSGFQDSRSTWTVFNAGLSEDLHHQAIEFAETVLVPAPGAAALGVLSLGLLATRRRRG